MTWFVLGIVLFALGIFVSVCLHEAGHMYTAKAFGMKVTRYFAGFGPTLWSFKRGETEYGLKAIPAGGFVKIVGMTPKDEDVEPGDEKRVFWKKPLWKRTTVLAAGSVTHFILGFALLWITAVFVGVPNLEGMPGARAEIASVSSCIQQFDASKAEFNECAGDAPASPAKSAGLHGGDIVTAVNGAGVDSWEQMAEKMRDVKGPVTLSVDRDGESREFTMNPVEVERPKADATLNDDGGVDKDQLETVSVVGITAQRQITVGPVEGIGAAGDYTGRVFTGTFAALQKFPEKIPKLFDALMGEKRDPETPVSVVGASRIGGEAAEAGIWPAFFFLLASLNVFIGIFNLLPLLPLDGGHIAIAWFERVRSWIAAKRGKADPGRVDYEKLMPVTYAVIAVFGSLAVLTILVDIVNPISLYG